MEKKMKWVMDSMAIVCLLMLTSCESQEAKCIRQLNEVIGFTNILVPIGDFVFDEQSPETYPMAGRLDITLEQLAALRDKGVIDVEVLEQSGKIYRVNVELTEEGRKYQVTESEKLRGKHTSTSFMYVKGYREKAKSIKSLEFDKESKIGKCYYYTVYDEVTPFAEVYQKKKNGEPIEEADYRKFVLNDKGEWEPEVY